jgi:hypothetical protein
MNLQEIRQIARERGIKPGNLTKLKLIRTIQREEENFECFATAVDGVCDQYNCCWRKDCFYMAAKSKKT